MKKTGLDESSNLVVKSHTLIKDDIKILGGKFNVR